MPATRRSISQQRDSNSNWPSARSIMAQTVLPKTGAERQERRHPDPSRSPHPMCGSRPTFTSVGAKPDLPSKNGSTPLHLAVQNTGRGGSGGPEAVEQQRQIILLLLQNGAPIKLNDGSGKTVEQAATVGWIRKLLHPVLSKSPVQRSSHVTISQYLLVFRVPAG